MTGPADKEAGRLRAALNARRTRYDQSDVIDSYYEYASPEEAILRELRESDLRVVLDRLRQLEGEQLNPATETLDADAYRHLRDEIAATMTDDWDGDEAEPWILAQYVRWLAAGQPRDEDGYPVRRENYPAAGPDDRKQLAARVAELERALADVDMRFRLSHGGGWCATCRWPMREGTPVVKTLAVVCEPCAADLAATAGRLDPNRLAVRKGVTLGTEDPT